MAIDRDGLDALIQCLAHDGYQVIGPRVENSAVVLGPVAGVADLPKGWTDEQAGGHYRLVADGRGEDGALFGFTLAAQGWKRYLHPPRTRLWQAHREGRSWRVEAEDAAPRYAFLGVRACELSAIHVLDRVFDNGQFTDPGYAKRRGGTFIVAVNCGRAAATCFCASMATGPKAEAGFDLALTELSDSASARFVVEVGSRAGAAVLTGIPHGPATAADIAAAERAVANATAQMQRAAGGREMVDDAAGVLSRNVEHPQWDKVAARCLGCGNCTAVCPTCFCTSMEDTTDLSGDVAERWRRWDSCFTLDFSYIHGGSVRRATASRYRQWITHKLSYWHEQFGTSGCVGCGRCITWCPVGIDITEEARTLAESEGRT
ncbi:MAG: 4Fe-4S dicluster domain-containing protein [Rhodospirillaceae bacterium]|nr:4Fe-4S dicluster domain-containing protein [Rhodospirillaceae bacterium]